ncbi:MAG TPA: hypothetical protein VMP08_17950, partial [Anaerolineae bacterium]|nr:hypothetical protein [Anaerolineae bacterium]
MFKSSSNLWRGLTVLMILSMVLAACAPAATPTPAPQPTEPPAQPTVAPQPTEAPTQQPTEASKATEASTPTEQAKPTEPPTPAPFVSTSSGKQAPSGFDCPAPANKIDVKSKELNLFVWTEYIPQDIIDCFEAVYGVKINRKEYSSNEEMYASLSKGSSIYDIVQPTDYIVSLMVRQGLLQKI